jgi:Tol biopolymer transport system component
MKWAVACVAVCACGRIDFDPIATDDAGTPDSATACATWNPWSAPVRLISGINSASFDWAPSISDDGLHLTFSSDRSGNFELYTATRGATVYDWSAGTILSELSMNGPEEDDATTSSNELEMIYGNTLLFRTTRASTSAAWNAPTVLVPNDFQLVQGAELTRDDLRLYFAAGSPSQDLYVMERPTPTSAFGAYAMIMPDPDPGNDMGYPTLSADELELYVSANHGGEQDIFVARRANRTDAFPQVTREPMLSLPGVDDWDPELSKDGTAMFFATDSGGGIDLHVATRTCAD